MRSLRFIVPLLVAIAVLVISALRWVGIRQDSRVVVDTRFMMNTMVTIKVIGEEEGRARKAMGEAFAAISRVEGLLSAYVEKSDVSRINEAAGKGYVVVSPDALKVIGTSIHYAELTAGAFDPTIGPLVHLWGFDKGEGHLPEEWEITMALDKVDYKKLRVDIEKGEVMLREEGMRLDLGGAAKGYAVDVAMDVLKGYGIRSALIDAGMSSIRSLGRKPSGESWRIGIAHPRNPEEYLGVLLLGEGEAVGTSGDYQQFFMRNGERYFHILDPRTGWQPRGMMSVTIIAPTGLEADILSTAVFVLGPEEGMRFVKGRDGVEAVIVTESGEILLSPGLEGRLESVGGSGRTH